MVKNGMMYQLDTNAYDMMIGATAVYYGFTLVTHNTKHYTNIPDILLEDWQQ